MAIVEATSAEDFICAVADVSLPSERENALLVVVADEYEQVITNARRLQRPIDSDICKLLAALSEIRELRTGGDATAAAKRMKTIANDAIRAHNRISLGTREVPS